MAKKLWMLLYFCFCLQLILMMRFEGFVSKFYCKCIFGGLYDFNFFFPFFIGKLSFFFF